MVEVELRRAGPTGVQVAARLRVDGEHSEAAGDLRLIDFTLPAPDRRAFLEHGERRRVHFNENPEEWARNLEAVYRSGQLMAVTVDDSNPLPAPPARERPKVEMPDSGARVAAH